MEKAILIYPACKAEKDSSSIIMPLSLIFAATPLKDEFDIAIIDQRISGDWRARLRKELAPGNKVACAGISTMTGPQIEGALEAAGAIRQIAPELPVVWGGVHPSLDAERTVEHELVDIVAKGDGEETLKELARALRDGKDLKNIAGLVYKENGTAVATAERKQFPLEKLGCPAYELVEIDKYRFSPLGLDIDAFPLVTSRGCPEKCSYCYNARFSKRRWTALSPEQTVDLIARLAKKFRAKNFALLDDNFFANLHRVERICELLLRKNLKIGIYNANCRVDSIVKMDHTLLRLLKRAGVEHLYIGVESGSNDVLRKIRKNITVEQVAAAADKLAKVSIKPFYSFMAGFPFETRRDVEKTVKLMSRLLKQNRDSVVYRLQLFTPFPGTELYDRAWESGARFPERLEGWASYHYDKLNCGFFDRDHSRFLEDMSLFTTYIDQRIFRDFGFLRRARALVYSKMLSYRIRRENYNAMWELWPLKAAKKLKRKNRKP